MKRAVRTRRTSTAFIDSFLLGGIETADHAVEAQDQPGSGAVEPCDKELWIVGHGDDAGVGRCSGRSRRPRRQFGEHRRRAPPPRRVRRPRARLVVPRCPRNRRPAEGSRARRFSVVCRQSRVNLVQRFTERPGHHLLAVLSKSLVKTGAGCQPGEMPMLFSPSGNGTPSCRPDDDGQSGQNDPAAGEQRRPQRLFEPHHTGSTPIGGISSVKGNS